MNWSAIIAAIVSVGAAASLAGGHAALAAMFKDPQTAAELTAGIGAIGGLVSAFSDAVYKGTTPRT